MWSYPLASFASDALAACSRLAGLAYDPGMVGRFRFGVALTLVVLTFGVARTALGHSNGVTGSSGKSSGTCNNCHFGGPSPKVTLAGPTQLEAGVPATYTLFVESTNKISGMNAAATDDVVFGDDDGGTTRVQGGEVTHARTLAIVDGGALYTFSLTAPYGETITLYAAGNAADDNGQSDGDRASSAQLAIAVDGPPRPPPPPAPTPTPKPAPTPTTPPPSVPDASADGGGPAAEPSSDGGCALGGTTGDVASSAGGGALVTLLAAARLARRRRR